MKYLVTDPCYIIDGQGLDSPWDKFLSETSFGDYLPEGGYKIEGIGKIVEMSGTDNGDGSVKVKNHKNETFEIGVDAGLVCIAQVSNNFKLRKNYPLGALTDSKEQADEWFEKACRI